MVSPGKKTHGPPCQKLGTQCGGHADLPDHATVGDPDKRVIT